MRLVKALNKYLVEKLLPEMTLKEAYEQHKIIRAPLITLLFFPPARSQIHI